MRSSVSSKQSSKPEKIQADDEALATIARQAGGGLRDAISLLDQLASAGTKITLQLTQTVLGTATRSERARSDRIAA